MTLRQASLRLDEKNVSALFGLLKHYLYLNKENGTNHQIQNLSLHGGWQSPNHIC